MEPDLRRIGAGIGVSCMRRMGYSLDMMGIGICTCPVPLGWNTMKLVMSLWSQRSVVRIENNVSGSGSGSVCVSGVEAILLSHIMCTTAVGDSGFALICTR